MSERVSLRRLLERETVETILRNFAPLMPDTELAIFDSRGRLFVHSENWSGGVDLLRELPFMTADESVIGVLGVKGFLSDAVDIALQALYTTLQMLLQEGSQTRDVVEETLYRYREINLLYRIGESINAQLPDNEIYERILSEASHVIAADLSLVLVSSQTGLTTFTCSGQTEFVDSLVEAAYAQIDHCKLKGQPDMVTDVPIGTFPSGSILVAPLETETQIWGFAVLGRFMPDAMFTASDGKLLTAIARQAAVSIETRRLHEQEIQRQLLEKELSVGREIQLSLLPPQCPGVVGWEFASYYEAARQVGGDLYDFIMLPDSRMGLLIADVTGKGVPAAMYMAMCRMIIRAEARSENSPASVLEHTNLHVLEDSRTELFLTAFYAVLGAGSGDVVFANGGHDYPLWFHAQTGQCEFITSKGYVIGAFRNVIWQESCIQLEVGDALVLYTDGVTEARNAEGERFEEHRLQAVLESTHHQTADDIQLSIVAAVKDFCGDTPQTDDLTLVIVKRV